MIIPSKSDQFFVHHMKRIFSSFLTVIMLFPAMAGKSSGDSGAPRNITIHTGDALMPISPQFFGVNFL